jgi:ABC-type amino acid transport substrate-binding protein
MVSFRLIREQIRPAGGKREPPARVIEGRRATPESQVVIVVAALLAGVAALCNVACARPLDDVLQGGAVRIGVYRDNPPFSFRRDGKLVGVDVDIGRAIAERLKLEPTYMEITAGETVDDDLSNAVWKGHYLGGGVVDLMLSVPYDRAFAQRNPNAAFFAPYLGQEFALARSPSAADDTGLEAFRSEKIGVELGSLPDFFLTSTLQGALRSNVVHFGTVREAAKALLAGQVAGLMATRIQLEDALSERLKDFDVSAVSMQTLGRSTWQIGIAVKEDSRDLGYAAEDILTALIADGTMAAIFRSHGLTYRPPQSF